MRALGYTPDPAQPKPVALFDELRDALARAGAEGPAQRPALARQAARAAARLYVWGGVGRGKTWLMDLFFHSLPFRDKQRSHFHRFMQSVHDELKKHKDRADPLELVAEKVAQQDACAVLR